MTKLRTPTSRDLHEASQTPPCVSGGLLENVPSHTTHTPRPHIQFPPLCAGDYLSDALAAQVGGIGIAPGGNINYKTGHAIFEATHGTAPKYANLDQVNPGSVILSGEMMLRHLGCVRVGGRGGHRQPQGQSSPCRFRGGRVGGVGVERLAQWAGGLGCAAGAHHASCRDAVA